MKTKNFPLAIIFLLILLSLISISVFSQQQLVGDVSISFEIKNLEHSEGDRVDFSLFVPGVSEEEPNLDGQLSTQIATSQKFDNLPVKMYYLNKEVSNAILNFKDGKISLSSISASFVIPLKDWTVNEDSLSTSFAFDIFNEKDELIGGVNNVLKLTAFNEEISQITEDFVGSSTLKISLDATKTDVEIVEEKDEFNLKNLFFRITFFDLKWPEINEFQVLNVFQQNIKNSNEVDFDAEIKISRNFELPKDRYVIIERESSSKRDDLTKKYYRSYFSLSKLNYLSYNNKFHTKKAVYENGLLKINGVIPIYKNQEGEIIDESKLEKLGDFNIEIVVKIFFSAGMQIFPSNSLLSVFDATLTEIGINKVDGFSTFYYGAVLLDSAPLNDVSITIKSKTGSFSTKSVNGYYKLRVSASEKELLKASVGTSAVFYFYNILSESPVFIPFSVSSKSYKDSDKDGVPDYLDRCPDTKNSFAVDSKGCDCNQIIEKKECKGVCVTKNNYPNCLQTCDDGIQNQKEEGVDCGEECKIDCKQVQCEKKNSCLSDAPKYCDNENNVVNNCQNCGCPKDFSCKNDGQCYKTIDLIGVRCKTNKFEYSLDGLDCSSFGSGWYSEDPSPFISVKVSGFPGIKNKVKKKIKKAIGKAGVCIKTESSCLPQGSLCPDEDTFEQDKKSFEGIIQEEIDSTLKRAQPSWTKIFVKPKIKVSLDSFKIRESFTCKSEEVTPEQSCKKIIDNGPSEDKADIVFVGNEWFTFDDLEKYVKKLIDYESVNENTDDEGLFSVEPFKSNRQKFNVWIVPAKYSINYDNLPVYGFSPVDEDIFSFANTCGAMDYVISLSKKSFRASCHYGRPSLCKNGRDFYGGRLLLHEFGHGFAKLDDEYHNDVKIKDNPSKIEKFSATKTKWINCQNNKESAERVWGDLVKEGGRISYFNGCGDDYCGDQCTSFIRPTLNSIMKNQRCKLKNPEDQECSVSGKYFTKYYAVNEREILKELAKYK